MFTLLLTCEHASNVVPRAYQHCFSTAAAKRALETHAGVDLGAQALARSLQSSFEVPLFEGEVTRLLVELNRSPRHPKLWSQYSQNLSSAEKREIRDRYYDAHRRVVFEYIQSCASRQAVLHIGVHSFTPVLNGQVRNADVGLLYDPSRRAEQDVCVRWQQALAKAHPGLRVRRNYPYRGNSDGLTTSLRREFSAERYLGIELEVNQAKLVGTTSDPDQVARIISQTLRPILTGACTENTSRLVTFPPKP